MDDNDEIPWADPEIQLAYEAALGKYIVLFNQIDNQLADLIRTVLMKLGRPDMKKGWKARDFSYKLTVLDLLTLSSKPEGLKYVPFDQLRQLEGERNVLAHGHFDQNPFQGSYEIVGKKRIEYPVHRIHKLVARAEEVAHSLRHAQGYYDFSD